MQGQNPDNTEHSLMQQVWTALDYSSLFKDPDSVLTFFLSVILIFKILLTD